MSGSASVDAEPRSITDIKPTEYYEQEFTAEPDRVAVDKKQIQLENEQNAWLYTAIDIDTKVVLHA